jgi:hypothetical protein
VVDVDAMAVDGDRTFAALAVAQGQAAVLERNPVDQALGPDDLDAGARPGAAWVKITSAGTSICRASEPLQAICRVVVSP